MTVIAALLTLVVASVPSEVSVSADTASPDEGRHGFSARVGLRGTSAQDATLVPLTFSGGGLELGTQYRGHLGPGVLEARFAIGFDAIANRFGHLGLHIDHALAAGYLMPFGSAGDWRFRLGPALGENSDTLALLSWDDAHSYWLGTTWLGPRLNVSGPLGGGWKLDLTAEVALIGTYGRPPEFRTNKQDPQTQVSYYLFDTQANPKVFSPLEVQLARVELMAHPPGSAVVGRGWTFGLEARMARATTPQPVVVLETLAIAGWSWGL